MYPDLLRDLDTEDDGADKKYLTKEVPGQWRSLWLDVTVDAELAGGDYAIVIETETEDGEKETLKADLHVVDASLPPQKLLHTEWFHSDCLADYYHVKPFSEEHWKILENFCGQHNYRNIRYRSELTAYCQAVCSGHHYIKNYNPFNESKIPFKKNGYEHQKGDRSGAFGY